MIHRVLVVAVAGALALILSAAGVSLQTDGPLSAAPAPVRAASPGLAASADPSASPGPSASAGLGDTRTPGEPPGFVGAPLLAILVVLAVGGVTALLTIAYVRLTGGPGRSH